MHVYKADFPILMTLNRTKPEIMRVYVFPDLTGDYFGAAEIFAAP